MPVHYMPCVFLYNLSDQINKIGSRHLRVHHDCNRLNFVAERIFKKFRRRRELDLNYVQLRNRRKTSAEVTSIQLRVMCKYTSTSLIKPGSLHTI